MLKDMGERGLEALNSTRKKIAHWAIFLAKERKKPLLSDAV